MSQTLFDAMQGAYRKLGVIRYATSSAATTTSINAAVLSSATSDDDFNQGTIFFQTATSGAAGQFRRIDDYVASSGQFSFSSALSTSPGSSAIFGYTTPEFNHELMIQVTNDALRSLGPLTFTDRATVSSANQQVYTLSTNIKYADPLRVDYMGRIGSSTDDPEWKMLSGGWHVEPSTAGSGNLLVLDRQPLVTRDLRVWFNTDHGRVENSTSILDERIHPELLHVAVAYRAMQYRNARNRGTQDWDLQKEDQLAQEFAEARIRWPIWREARRSKMMVLGDTPRGGDRAPWPPPYGPS